jgi:minichromosome maintenance protein 10
MGGGQDAADRALKSLLERDKEGMKAVMSARESGKVLMNSEEGKKGRNKCEQGKGDRKGKQVADDACGEENDACGAKKKQQSFYSAGVVRSLGFDPSIKTGSRRIDNSSSQNKVYFPLLTYLVLLSLCSQLDLLEAVRTSRKDIILGPRPGPKIRSGVMTPRRDETLSKLSDNGHLKDLDNEKEEVPDKLAMKSQVVEEKLVDLDDF